jgi:hypothetical protein
VSVYDANFGYLIEQGAYPYFLGVTKTDVISISNLQYTFQNLDSISNLQIDFSIPRTMFPNEILDLNVGPSLQGNNQNTLRLSLLMYDSLGNNINIIGTLKSQILTIQFTSGVLLAQGSYTLKINNIRTPSTQTSDEIQVNFRRSTDNIYVMGQKIGAYTPFPGLVFKASANVSIV